MSHFDLDWPTSVTQCYKSILVLTIAKGTCSARCCCHFFLSPSVSFLWGISFKKIRAFLLNPRCAFSSNLIKNIKNNKCYHISGIALYIKPYTSNSHLQSQMQMLFQIEPSDIWTFICMCLRHPCRQAAGPWTSANILLKKHGNWNEGISIN